MIKKTLEDGTVVICDWSEGGHLSVYCACAGDEADPISLGCNEEEACSGCGKKYGAWTYTTLELSVDDVYKEKF